MPSFARHRHLELDLLGSGRPDSTAFFSPTVALVRDIVAFKQMVKVDAAAVVTTMTQGFGPAAERKEPHHVRGVFGCSVYRHLRPAIRIYASDPDEAWAEALARSRVGSVLFIDVPPESNLQGQSTGLDRYASLCGIHYMELRTPLPPKASTAAGFSPAYLGGYGLYCVATVAAEHPYAPLPRTTDLADRGESAKGLARYIDRPHGIVSVACGYTIVDLICASASAR